MVKMVAQRLYYHPDDGKEYKAGETFHVTNEREAERLERRHKAMRAAVETAKPAHVDPPKPAVTTPVEDEATAPVQAPIGTEEPLIETDVPAAEPPKRHYRRRDLSAEQD